MKCIFFLMHAIATYCFYIPSRGLWMEDLFPHFRANVTVLVSRRSARNWIMARDSRKRSCFEKITLGFLLEGKWKAIILSEDIMLACRKWHKWCPISLRVRACTHENLIFVYGLHMEVCFGVLVLVSYKQAFVGKIWRYEKSLGQFFFTHDPFYNPFFYLQNLLYSILYSGVSVEIFC